MHSSRLPVKRNHPRRYKPPQRAPQAGGTEAYTVTVNGKSFDVMVAPGGAVQSLSPAVSPSPPQPKAGTPLPAPLAGTIFKIKVAEGQAITEGDVVVVMEAMKMETEVRATRSGIVLSISVKEGDAVQVGSTLLTLG